MNTSTVGFIRRPKRVSFSPCSRWICPLIECPDQGLCHSGNMDPSIQILPLLPPLLPTHARDQTSTTAISLPVPNTYYFNALTHPIWCTSLSKSTMRAEIACTQD